MAGTIEVNKTFQTELDETKRREISDIEWLQQGAGAVSRGHAVASVVDPRLVVPRGASTYCAQDILVDWLGLGLSPPTG